MQHVAPVRLGADERAAAVALARVGHAVRALALRAEHVVEDLAVVLAVALRVAEGLHLRLLQEARRGAAARERAPAGDEAAAPGSQRGVGEAGDPIIYYTMLYYAMLYYTVRYYTIIYHIILYNTILYYAMLY